MRRSTAAIALSLALSTISVARPATAQQTKVWETSYGTFSAVVSGPNTGQLRRNGALVGGSLCKDSGRTASTITHIRAPTPRQFIVGCDDGDLYVTDDAAATWRLVLLVDGARGPLRGLAVAADGRTLATFHPQSAWLSRDSGQTWTLVSFSEADAVFASSPVGLPDECNGHWLRMDDDRTAMIRYLREVAGCTGGAWILLVKTVDDGRVGYGTGLTLSDLFQQSAEHGWAPMGPAEYVPPVSLPATRLAEAGSTSSRDREGAQSDEDFELRGATVHVTPTTSFVGTILVRGGQIYGLSSSRSISNDVTLIEGTGQHVYPVSCDRTLEVGMPGQLLVVSEAGLFCTQGRLRATSGVMGFTLGVSESAIATLPTAAHEILSRRAQYLAGGAAPSRGSQSSVRSSQTTPVATGSRQLTASQSEIESYAAQLNALLTSYSSARSECGATSSAYNSTDDRLAVTISTWRPCPDTYRSEEVRLADLESSPKLTTPSYDDATVIVSLTCRSYAPCVQYASRWEGEADSGTQSSTLIFSGPSREAEAVSRAARGLIEIAHQGWTSVGLALASETGGPRNDPARPAGYTPTGSSQPAENSNQQPYRPPPPKPSVLEQLQGAVESTAESLNQQLERQRRENEALMRERQAQQERNRQAELERQRQAELQRQRQAELNRQRQAELERQRQADLDQQRRDAEEARRRNPDQIVGDWWWGPNSRGHTAEFHARGGNGAYSATYAGRISWNNGPLTVFRATIRNLRVTHTGSWIDYEGEANCTEFYETSGYTGLRTGKPWDYIRLTLYPNEYNADPPALSGNWGCHIGTDVPRMTKR